MVRKLLIGLAIFLFVTSPIILAWAFTFYSNLQERNNPQRQLLKSAKKELLSLNMRDLYPEEIANGKDGLQQEWLAGIERGNKYLLEEKFDQVQEELVVIKKAIEKASRGDKYSFKIGRLPNDPDQNGNGISDLLEKLYQKLTEITETNG